MVEHACNSSTWEMEARGRESLTSQQVQGQPGLHEMLSQNNQQKRKKKGKEEIQTQIDGVEGRQ